MNDIEKNKNNVEYNYDFGEGRIPENHKIVINEAVKLLEKFNMIESAELLKKEFHLKKENTFDLQKSVFYHMWKSFGKTASVQGHIVEGLGLNAVKYPLYCIQEDIRVFDSFIEYVIKNYGTKK